MALRAGKAGAFGGKHMTPEQRKIISDLRDVIEERRALGHADENIRHAPVQSEGWPVGAVSVAMEVK